MYIYIYTHTHIFIYIYIYIYIYICIWINIILQILPRSFSVISRAGHALFFTLRACAFALFGGALHAGAFALFFGP